MGIRENIHVAATAALWGEDNSDASAAGARVTEAVVAVLVREGIILREDLEEPTRPAKGQTSV